MSAWFALSSPSGAGRKKAKTSRLDALDKDKEVESFPDEKRKKAEKEEKPRRRSSKIEEEEESEEDSIEVEIDTKPSGFS